MTAIAVNSYPRAVHGGREARWLRYSLDPKSCVDFWDARDIVGVICKISGMDWLRCHECNGVGGNDDDDDDDDYYDKGEGMVLSKMLDHGVVVITSTFAAQGFWSLSTQAPGRIC